MPYQVAVIGSFQKYYDEICEVIREFKKCGLIVTSPKDSFITNKIEDFVIFESDCKNYTPSEIQMITLEKIMRADAVYVYNPDGYVGKTTCYEIGFCFSRRKQLYFLQRPKDLPIPFKEDIQVITPSDFSKIISNQEQYVIGNYDFCLEAANAFNKVFEINKKVDCEKRIVICGSMRFYDEMFKCKDELYKIGIDSIIPKEENNIIHNLNEEQFAEFKRKVSNSYLRKIRDRDTVGVLIMNMEKNGIKNYIGANTLVELAMAFTWNRKIFLYNDIYEPLKEELLAWNVICLHGILQDIKKYMIFKEPDTTISYKQLRFF